MNKRIFVSLMTILVLAGTAHGREIQRAEGTSLTVKTLTEFGVDLDHPYKYGLNFSVPELALTLDLFGYQKVTNRVKSPDPVGFLDLTLGQTQIRFANMGQPDYNNSTNHSVGFGFNDSNSATNTTGFFGPLYLQNVRSGIVWGDWLLQLGAGGTDSFWDPWHRENVGYAEINTSWAYLDTRVQYQRDLIPVLVKDRMTKPDGFADETNYWAYDDQMKSIATGVDELSLGFKGPMVGLQYAGGPFSTMVKVGTNYNWYSDKLTEATPNGVLLGLDASYSPTEVKGLRFLASGMYTLNQAAPANKTAIIGGVKVGYEVPLPKTGLKLESVEPYLGLDLAKALPHDGLDAGPLAVEAAAGLTLHWPGMNGWGYDYLQGPNGRTGNVFSGATLAYKVYSTDPAKAPLKNSVQLTWYNDEDGGLVNNLGSEFAAQWFDFTNPDGINTLQLTSYFGYNLSGVLGGVLVPWTKVYFDDFLKAGMKSRQQNVKIDGGLKLKKAIRNAEFGVTYESRNLLADSASTNAINGYGAVGVLKCSVQISL